jgi:hypothetical protein
VNEGEPILGVQGPPPRVAHPYIRAGDGWKMRRTTFSLKFITRFDQPWSVDRNASLRR